MRVREDIVVRPNGAEGLYGVVETGGAVFIVAIDEAERVLLVRLDRHTTGESLEIPAGGLDGQEPVVAARRELREEAGYAAVSWQHLATLAGLNGIAEAQHHFFLARDLSETGESVADQQEEGILAVQRIALDEALRMCFMGEITDVDTVAGLALARDALAREELAG